MAAQLSAPGRAKRASARKAPRVKCQCQRARLSCRQSVRTQYDAETGFYFLRTRYYDPTVGRFVQEDKIGRAGGLNLYAYAGGRPLAARDPMGTMADYYLLGELLWTPPSHNCWSQLACNRDGIDGRDLGGGRTAWDGFDILTYYEKDALWAVYQQNFAVQHAKRTFVNDKCSLVCARFTVALNYDQFVLLYSGIVVLAGRWQESTEAQYATTLWLAYLYSGRVVVNGLQTGNNVMASDVKNRLIYVNPNITDGFFQGPKTPEGWAFALAHEAGHFWYGHHWLSVDFESAASAFARRARGY
jgi:RHS repeat-associated protein